jgi:glutaminyl-peptide cyclotransferase
MPFPRACRRLAAVLLAFLAAAAAGLSAAAADEIPVSGYAVVRARPHDTAAFTEGLVFWNGMLIESIGLYGQSALRKVDLETGKVTQEVRLPDTIFGEGATVLGERVYQLTWKSGKGFIYDVQTLKRQGEFAYTGEGWGLTTDGTSLIMSDGTSRIRFIDPGTFQVTRSIDVTARGQPVQNLNELEIIRGVLYANVWKTRYVLEIDPATGRVLGSVDFTRILLAGDTTPSTDVMNGIAYDEKGDRIFVTGKNWPKLFEVRLDAPN